MKKHNSQSLQAVLLKLIPAVALLSTVMGCKTAANLIGSSTTATNSNNAVNSSGKANSKDSIANAFAGIWKPANDSRLKGEFQSITINSDGTYTVKGKHDETMTGTYSVTNGKLIFGGDFGAEMKGHGVDSVTMEGNRMKWSGNGEGVYYFDKADISSTGSESNKETSSEKNPQFADVTPPSPAQTSPEIIQAPGQSSGNSVKTVSSGVLNSKAVSLPNAAYPVTAKAVRASGTINVQVIVDENGNVVSASATEGHPLLRVAAENAARQATFDPPTLDGKSVRLSGILTYSFSA